MAGRVVSEPLFRPTERFFLDPDSPLPLYHQMEKIILDRISTEGDVGRQFPREMDLVEIFGVSRITVKKVTDSLVAKGLIRRRRALGSHIVSLGVSEDLGRLTSYTEQMESRGLKVSTEVLEVGTHVPSAKTREKLQLRENEQTLFVRRLRGTSEVFPGGAAAIGGSGRMRDQPGRGFPRLPLWLDGTKNTTFPSSGLRRKFRLPGLRSSKPSTWALPPATWSWSWNGRTFTSANRPLEFVRAVYRPEHYTFSVRLKRS